jgi:hypothetical protein
VAAALGPPAHGAIASIVDEIRVGIGDEADPARAEDMNIARSRDLVLASPAIFGLVQKYRCIVVAAKYDIETGEVAFI